MDLAIKRWCLLLAIMSLGGITFGQTVLPSLEQAKTLASITLTLNLRDHGWDAPEEPRHEINRPSIVIDHEGRIVLGFTVKARSGLVTRSQPSLDFRIMRFLPDGKVDLSLTLPTHERGVNAIYLSETDEIIARANDSLRILQAENGNLQTGEWKTLCAKSCRVLQSPTRRTLFLQSRNADPPLTIVRFLPQLTLQRCGKSPHPNSPEDRFQTYTQYITDQFGYFHGWEQEPGYFTYRWPLCNYQHRTEIPLGAAGSWAVLNDNLFVRYSTQGKDEEADVISADGRIKFRPTTGPYELASGMQVKSSEEGTVIAMDLVAVRGRNSILDMAGHVIARRVVVYDIEAGTELASIPVSPKHRYGYEFDLSPDGHHLAILEDGIVKVVKVN